jgi:ligand-binding SRPBCC domain-containing protein
VAGFHRDARALRRLTPPPLWVQLHRADSLADGAVADFTLWFGPLPVRWVALHSQVDPRRGFVDEMVRGPLRRWRHEHAFAAESADVTVVSDRITYDYRPGLGGLFGRAFFAGPGLRLLFAYRSWATRRALERPAFGLALPR